MSRDLRGLMRETTVAPEHELDLDELWRRGRRRRYLKRVGVPVVGVVLLIAVAVALLPAIRPAPPIVGDPAVQPLRIEQTVEVSQPGSLVAAAGRIWVASYQGPLRWVEPGTGRTGDGPVSSGSCGLGGGEDLLVVFRCGDPVVPNGELVAVDPGTGTVRWTTGVSGFVTSSAEAAGRVVALVQEGRDGWVGVFDSATGAELGRTEIERASVWSVVADTERTWVTVTRQPDATAPTRQVEVIAVDLATGEVAGRRTVGEDRGGPQRLGLRSDELWLPVEDAVVVLASDTLEEVARVRVAVAASEPTAGPVIATSADHVWIVDGNGVQAVDPADRAVIAETDIGRLRVTQPPAVADGRLWVPDRVGDRLVAVGWCSSAGCSAATRPTRRGWSSR